MRKLLTIFVVLLFATVCHSQEKNEIRVFGGVVGSELISEPMDGAGSSNNDTSLEYGVKCLRNITPEFCIETGLGFMQTKVEISPAFSGKSVVDWEEKLKVITIPLYGNYTFGKYFFVNGGFILSFDKSDGSIDSQSGIGYGLGVGAKYNTKNFVFFVNPNFKRHSAFIKFHDEYNNERLTELGVQFGVGYRF